MGVLPQATSRGNLVVNITIFFEEVYCVQEEVCERIPPPPPSKNIDSTFYIY